MNRQYRMLAGPAAQVPVGGLATVDASPQTAGSYPGFFQLCLSGPTSARPNGSDGDFPAAAGNLQAGILFLDTTLGYIITSDGSGGWRNPNSGAAV
jgi:hypothetical protein